MLLDVAVYGGLQVDDGMEDPALEPPAGQGGKEALDSIEPGGRCRREVEHPPGMTSEPGADLGLLVRGVVVEDGVDDLATSRSMALRKRMSSW